MAVQRDESRVASNKLMNELLGWGRCITLSCGWKLDPVAGTWGQVMDRGMGGTLKKKREEMEGRPESRRSQERPLMKLVS